MNEQDFRDYMEACQNRAGAALEVTDWVELGNKATKTTFAANHGSRSPFAHIQFGLGGFTFSKEQLAGMGDADLAEIARKRRQGGHLLAEVQEVVAGRNLDIDQVAPPAHYYEGGAEKLPITKSYLPGSPFYKA